MVAKFQICVLACYFDVIMLGGASGKVVKICDFGLSGIAFSSDELSGTAGSPPYLAPEMVSVGGRHGLASDMWSFGVIVYTQFYGAFPYRF